MAPLFDHYVIVDWSAANRKKTGRDSIWICHIGPGGERCENPETRHRAKLLLAEILADAARRGERALLGFDFPFGYPAGFARRLGLSGIPWRAIWDEIARLVEDGEDNRNNRFSVGAELNRRVSDGRFPFWGCAVGFTDEFLGPKHHRGHAEQGLAEKRLIDCRMTGAQPCWKLAYTGSVGSQVLTGIPVVRELRDNRPWADAARIWPFETGLCLPEAARFVFAEVWPSWWNPEIRELAPVMPGAPKDKVQVLAVARIFAEQGRDGTLRSLFAGDPALTDEQRQRVETEEAWTLGVTAPRRPSAPSPPALRRERVGVRRAARQTAGSPHPPIAEAMGPSPSLEAGKGKSTGRDEYLRDPTEITQRSFAIIRAEADLDRFPKALRPLALRLVHASGDTALLADLAWSRGAVAAGHRALAAGAPILVDATMVAAGISRTRLPTANPVICTLPDIAAAPPGTTRSAAAVELWRPYLMGAVVAIGNAPTALFRLLELLAAGAPRPALVLGFPVGFVGAAESKAALAAFDHGLAYVTLHGRRGGSALAAAAVNALAGGT